MAEAALLEPPMTVPGSWRQLPAAAIATPILAIAARADGPLWVAGVGGTARMGEAAPAPDLRMAVSALAWCEGRLIAAGAEGFAYTDGGRWEQAQSRHGGSPVTAIVRAGAVLLAATLGDGVLRSTDAGRTWMPSGFGLADPEVTALLAGPESTVLAGTSAGIYRSTTAGRTWRRTCTAGSAPVAALASAPESLIAALEDGDILHSTDLGRSWTRQGRAPGSVSALAVLPDGTVLAGTDAAGISRSTDGGRSWHRAAGTDSCAGVYCLALTAAGAAYAGTAEGLAVSTDAGRHWQAVPVPPTHDLDRIHHLHGRPLLAGHLSGVAHHSRSGWERLPGAPFPVTTAAVTPAGRLLAAGPHGLFRYADDGWRALVPGEAGHVRCLTFCGRAGWATPAEAGDRLLRSDDGGLSWKTGSAPFGALSPAALHACKGLLLCAVADSRHNAVQLWSSGDDGATWDREQRIETTWPSVAGATVSNGAAIALGVGNRLILRNEVSARTATVPEGPIRAVAGTPSGLAVVAAGSLWSTGDPALRRWQREEFDAEILDLCCARGGLHLLLTDGRVLTRSVAFPYRRPAGEDHHD